MLAIVLIGVLLTLLVLSALTLAVFLDVAFADPIGSLTSTQQWQPPLMRGKDLRSWASNTARAATNKWLALPHGKATATRLAAEISRGASYAIAQSRNAVQQLAPNCPSCRQQMIGVTPPEALAIAETIRKTMSKQKVRRILELSTQNAKASADVDADQYEQSEITCPLWDGEASCMAFKVRPLRCRGWCLNSGEDGDHCLSDDGDTGSLDAHALTIGSGTKDGFSSGLQSAGLDGSVYELNSVLAVALDAPAASEQWSRGNEVFQKCKICK